MCGRIQTFIIIKIFKLTYIFRRLIIVLWRRVQTIHFILLSMFLVIDFRDTTFVVLFILYFTKNLIGICIKSMSLVQYKSLIFYRIIYMFMLLPIYV